MSKRIVKMRLSLAIFRNGNKNFTIRVIVIFGLKPPQTVLGRDFHFVTQMTSSIVHSFHQGTVFEAKTSTSTSPSNSIPQAKIDKETRFVLVAFPNPDI